MTATGEFIRMTNYVDDMTAVLRRITATVPVLNEEERKRLADYIRKSDPSLEAVLKLLESK